VETGWGNRGPRYWGRLLAARHRGSVCLDVAISWLEGRALAFPLATASLSSADRGRRLLWAWAQPEALRFEGATIGVNFSLTYIGPILFGGFALLAVFWVLRHLTGHRLHERVPWVWTRSARIRLILVVILVPVEAVLFHTGGVRSVQNVFGVGVVFWQWFTINRVIASARMPEISHPTI
jgi:hypothetical protein